MTLSVAFGSLLLLKCIILLVVARKLELGTWEAGVSLMADRAFYMVGSFLTSSCSILLTSLTYSLESMGFSKDPVLFLEWAVLSLVSMSSLPTISVVDTPSVRLNILKRPLLERNAHMSVPSRS